MTEYEWRQKFGKHLQDLLNRKDISAYKASKESGVPLNNWYTYIRGEVTPTVFTALKLARYFHISLDELLRV